MNEHLVERQVRRSLPGEPLPCPFCGELPKVTWTSGVTIKCKTSICTKPRTDRWAKGFEDKALKQWNMRSHRCEMGMENMSKYIEALNA